MQPRVHDALDGDIAARALSAAERGELAEAAWQFDAVLRALPDEPLPDLAPAVLARIRRGAASPAADAPATPRAVTTSAAPRRPAGWLWRPRSVSFTWRPAQALAAAALVAVGVAIGEQRARGAPADTVPIAAPAAAPEVFTRFVLAAPDARQVAVAGDFTGWQPAHQMVRMADGVWTVVVSLPPGVHDYAFVIDGQRWVPDPAAPAVADGFGGVNSRVTVMPPERRGS